MQCCPSAFGSHGFRASTHARCYPSACRPVGTARPIFELHPNRRHGQLPARVSQRVPCFGLTLSREPKDLLKVLATLPIPTAAAVVRPRDLRVAV